MTLSLIILMCSFSFIMSITPGPVNLMIISSGINYGFKKTFMFVSGATIGFTLLLIFVAFGLDKFINKDSYFMNIIEIIGTSFIIYLGYKILSTKSTIEIKNKNNNVLKFYQGFILQWLNPKAWIASISGISMFSMSLNTIYLFILIYFIICYLSLSFWAFIGERTTKFLNTNKRLKIFNVLMGSFLIFTAILLFIEKYLII
ncbi:MAG: LysE family translocator [Campylobacteraceae bacterium]|nr:LysE family translocator [Campylobacteraceae bacterium]